MAYRWDTDLSPGMRTDPVRRDAGEIFFCMETPILAMALVFDGNGVAGSVCSLDCDSCGRLRRTQVFPASVLKVDHVMGSPGRLLHLRMKLGHIAGRERLLFDAALPCRNR